MHPHNSSRRLAIPAAGSLPSFDNMFALARIGVLFDQTVLVISMTEEVLTSWQRRLQERGRPMDGLTLLDGRFGWSVDWRAFFCARSYDVTILHGLHTALREQALPRSYAERLLDAMRSGLIILA